LGAFGLRSSISFSLVFHVLFVLAWLIVFGRGEVHTPPKKLTWIEMVPTPTRHKVEDPSKRVVQTKVGEKSDQAAPDAFLGERTQTVDRQTVNKERTTAIGKANQVAKLEQPDDQRDQKKQHQKLNKLGVPILPDPKVAKDSRTQDEMGQGIPQDYIRGLKESETTALNTREYVFFSYFQRIRSRLDLAWSKTLHDQLLKLYRSGRKLATDIDHTTKILVTMNSQGEIVRVQVVEESGTRDLDDAAVKAFNQAGPFPNPPKGIIDRYGQIQIRWDFVLRS
jgi:TonB family protein